MARVSSSRSARSRAAVGSPTLPKPEVVGRAEAHREHEPPVRQHVERDGLAGELPRPSAGRREHDRADRDALGPHRDRREEDPRVVHLVVADRDRVVREHAVPAGRLGLGGEIRGEPRIARRQHNSVAHRTMIADARDAMRLTRASKRRSGRTRRRCAQRQRGVSGGDPRGPRRARHAPGHVADDRRADRRRAPRGPRVRRAVPAARRSGAPRQRARVCREHGG